MTPREKRRLRELDAVERDVKSMMDEIEYMRCLPLPPGADALLDDADTKHRSLLDRVRLLRQSIVRPM